MHTEEEILLEQALAEALKKQQCEQWLAEKPAFLKKQIQSCTEAELQHSRGTR